eukprot:COSAG04_NODE_332_length_16554_cov_392.698590_10_plen_166_part_00
MTDIFDSFSSGKSASFDCLVVDAPLSKQPFFQIQGSLGEIVLEGAFEGGMKLVTAEHPEGQVIESDPSGKGQRGFLHSYAPQLEDFGRAVRDGTPLAASAEYSVGEVAVITAMYGALDYRTAARTLFLRPYLAHFCSFFRRFFAAFSVLTPGIRRGAPKDRGAAA